jgi:hypothetical protein
LIFGYFRELLAVCVLLLSEIWRRCWLYLVVYHLVRLLLHGRLN